MITDKKLLKFVSESKLLELMKQRHKCYIVYETPNGVQLTRLIEPYILGKTKRGNSAIRAYQVTGGSNTVGWAAWKIFRLDRIIDVRDAGEFGTAPTSYTETDKHLTAIKYIVPAIPPVPVKEPEEKLPKTDIQKSPNVDTDFPLWKWIMSLRGKNKKK